MEMLDKDNSGMVEFPEFVRVLAKRAEVEEIKQKRAEFYEALEVKYSLWFFELLKEGPFSQESIDLIWSHIFGL